MCLIKRIKGLHSHQHHLATDINMLLCLFMKIKSKIIYTNFTSHERICVCSIIFQAQIYIFNTCYSSELLCKCKPSKRFWFRKERKKKSYMYSFILLCLKWSQYISVNQFVFFIYFYIMSFFVSELNKPKISVRSDLWNRMIRSTVNAIEIFERISFPCSWKWANRNVIPQ